MPDPNQRLLALAWLTVAGAHPLAHIDAAAEAGFDAVGLRLLSPPGGGAMVPLVEDAALMRDVRRRLDATGVTVLDVETLWIAPAFDAATLRPALDVAATLGARHLLVMGHDPDPQRLASQVATLCEVANGYGIAIGLEFAAYTDVPNLGAADALLRAAGDPPNASILVDALHFARSGGVPADVAALRPGRVGYCQLADACGPSPADADGLRNEARGGRCLPGEGELPLAALLRALPATTPVAIESPTRELALLPIADRARRAAAAARRLLDATAA